MADEGMDPCECIWSHELAMRRLISFLRQSQAYCTDSECLEDLPGGPQQATAEDKSFLMMTMFMAIAMIMFFMQPRFSRRSQDEKPSTSQGPPPPPAAPIN